ncbi:alpha/beta hydrolase [Rhodococcus erythropolis]|uniref:alpha/beta fold hydrolase n=1 Tax=Rhodococcus erythropolis TaxID=1833 RepID=UPI001E339D77|nr:MULTISPECIES: alpha/beta hydrolase [Rhodococcus erythropolis group]MCD2105341.1 alpha/beta hydrolase [Rhodococcus qingshengii]MCZ4524055.1 alpha/beta hydrolase [Rhodococcus erythropolis]
MTPQPRTYSVNEFEFETLVDGPQSGPPIILLHGFPETHNSWTAVSKLLTSKGMRSIAPNQRGYSAGARPPHIADYRLDRLVADVIGLLDALELNSAHLVGHDWGSAVAWAVAARHPDRIRTLTCASIPHTSAFSWALANDLDQQTRSGYIRRFWQQGKAEEELLADNSRGLRGLFGGHPDTAVADHNIGHLSERETLTAALNWYRAMSPDDSALPPVRVPTTYLWGTQDAAMGRVGAELCQEFVTGPYTFIELEGVGHWVPAQATEALATAVIDRVQASPDHL